MYTREKDFIMADLSITAGNVAWVSGTRPKVVTGGATITRGQALYKDDSDNEYKLADAGAVGTAVLDGIALTDGTDGAEMLVAPRGATLNIGATTTAGTIYVISETAGGIAPVGDLATGDFVVVAFVGSGTANVEIIAQPATGIEIP